MRLEEIEQNPIISFMNMERYVNFDVSFNDTFLGDLNKKYSSFHGDDYIDLLFFSVDKSLISLIRSNNYIKKIGNQFIHDDVVSFPIHPQVFNSALSPELEELVNQAKSHKIVKAIPASSMRTLFVQEEGESFFVKTHFPKRISSINRELTQKDVFIGTYLVNELDHLANQGNLPKYLGYIPDLFGCTYQKVGFLVRSYSSMPQTKTKYKMPLMSLVAFDKKIPNDKLLVEQLANKADKDVIDYYIDDVITPHIKSWKYMIFELGRLFTAHGQNMVMEYDNNWNFTRIVYRDLQPKKLIPNFRKEKGFSDPEHFFNLKDMTMSEIKLFISASYDFKLGYLLFDRAINVFKKSGFETSDISSRIKEVFDKEIGDYKSFFSPKLHHYRGFLDNKRIVALNETPKYR